MAEINWHRIRGILINSFSVDESSMIFDTEDALSKGYIRAEIKAADKIIESTICSLEKESQIRADLYSTSEMAEINPYILYIEEVRLIFIISKDTLKYTCIFEEDLIADVAKLNAMAAHLDYLEHNSLCDIYGDPIYKD